MTEDREELLRQLRETKARIRALDAEEPEDMDSEDYDRWACRHEELEDLRDELEEALEE